MITFNNLDLLSVGVAIAGILILGFVIYLNNRRDAINKIFLLVSLAASFWAIFNYLSHQFDSEYLVLWFLRFEIFFAIWYAFLIYHLFYIFYTDNIDKRKRNIKIFIPVVLVVACLNLTPFVFSRVSEFSIEGKVSKVVNGPGIFIFGALAFYFLIGGFIFLIRKTLKSSDIERKRFRMVTIGTIITYTLILIFNFVFPAFLNNANFVEFGALFIFPFIFFTFYAIYRHGLLNIKIIATEILTFVLSVAMFIEIIFSNEIALIIFRSSSFLLVLSFGILLIRSVRKEVQQREQLQILTEELAYANEKLKVLDKARAEFISIASHQLRTPPSTIKWYLSSMLSGDFGRLKPELKDALEKTQLTNNSLISLIEDLLNVSRIERGKMEFAFKDTDVLVLIETTLNQLAPFAKMKKLKLVFKKPKISVPHVMADTEKLRQVINNLIDNAIKYTKMGTIKIALEQKGDNVIFSVADTGKGVLQEEKNNIFEKFGRGNDSIKYAAGLGLGLYLAKIVIDQHKGKIWVESLGQGKGSTFIFSLPIHSNIKTEAVLDLTENR